MSDLVIASMLTADPNPWGVHLRGERRTAASLAVADTQEYLAPFAATCEQWGLNGVVLHDGLAPDAYTRLESNRVRFVRVSQAVRAGQPTYERRWFHFRDYLTGRAEIDRVWVVDVGDVVFTEHPFEFLGKHPAGTLIANEESEPENFYGTNPWFQGNLAPCRDWMRDPILTGRHAGRHPVNCGAWGSDAVTARDVLNRMCGDFVRNEGPVTPAVDMALFGLIALDHYQDRLVTFPRFQGPPLIHNRDDAVRRADKYGSVKPMRRYDVKGESPHDRVFGLIDLVDHIGPVQRVMEIGSHKGVSTEVWLLSGAEVTCVDPVGHPDFDRLKGHPRLTVIRGFSPAAVAELPDRHFDAVYIDAAHDCASVTADINTSRSKLKPGGWMTGHDFSDGCGVPEAVRATLGEPDRVFADTSWAKRLS